jgi:hypothetical protein
MELKAESRAELGFPQGTLLPIIRSPGPDEALCSTQTFVLLAPLKPLRMVLDGPKALHLRC